MLRTGKPANIIISAPHDEAHRLRQYVAKVKAIGDRSVALYHGHIDMTLGIDFEKTNGVKKVKTFQHILDAARDRGYGGDVVGWIRNGQERRVPLHMLKEGFEVGGEAKEDKAAVEGEGAPTEERIVWRKDGPIKVVVKGEAPPSEGKIAWGKDGPVNTGVVKRGLVTKFYM